MKTRSVPGGIIVPVILVMFIMLSLGALRMMSSFADLKLARASAREIMLYYGLEKEASGELQKVNMALANWYNADSCDFSRDKLCFPENENWIISERDGKIFIHRIVSLEGNTAQNLFVELLLSPPDENGRYYKIFQWRQWRDDLEYEQEGLDIWTGQMK